MLLARRGIWQRQQPIGVAYHILEERNMAVFTILTEDGIADAGQEEALEQLTTELAKPDVKVLLHLHGGLVSQKNGEKIAKQLSGTGPDSLQLGSDWTQIYVVWRTGPFETFKTNWQDPCAGSAEPVLPRAARKSKR